MTSADAPPRFLLRPLPALAAAVVVVMLAYLAFTVPASWFPSSPVKHWGVRDLTLPRGIGGAVNNELIVTGADASGQVYVAVTTDLRARDYATITWDAHGVPADADVHFLWRTDYAPKKIFSVPVTVEGGRLLPVVLANDAGWLGHVTGIGLALRGTLAQPFAVSGVAAKPSGAVGILQDRAREWLLFERWKGTSINTIVGGDDLQPLPLPLLLAASIALAAGAMLLWRRFRQPSIGMAEAVAAMAIMFAVSWFVLDVRWTWNLARQPRPDLPLTGSSGIQTGVMEAHFALEQGRFLKEVCLAGDFIANSPAIASLEYRLRLCPAERGAIARVVDAAFGDPSNYLLGVGPLGAVADTIIKGLPA